MNQTALTQQIDQFVEQHNLLPTNSTVVLGLSGGPDSVFLLHLLHSYQTKKKLTIIAAHLDHQWRPNSAQDVVFCQTLCKKLGITFVYKRAAQLPDSLKKSSSQEQVGRTMRRHFLQDVRKQYGAASIALGHHLQDQEETFFIRLIRGASLTGLCCMRPRNGHYIRPLLASCKSDIIASLKDRNIAYLQDPSNISDAFLRNRIRNALPALHESDKRFGGHIAEAIASLQHADDYLAQHTRTTFCTLATQIEGSWRVNARKLVTFDDYLQSRIILHWLIEERVPFVPSQAFLAEIKRFLCRNQGGQHQLGTIWAIEKKRGICRVVRCANKT